jgi:hypothetical protein
MPARTITIGGEMTVGRIGFGAMRITYRRVHGTRAGLAAAVEPSGDDPASS